MFLVVVGAATVVVVSGGSSFNGNRRTCQHFFSFITTSCGAMTTNTSMHVTPKRMSEMSVDCSQSVLYISRAVRGGYDDKSFLGFCTKDPQELRCQAAPGPPCYKFQQMLLNLSGGETSACGHPS